MHLRHLVPAFVLLSSSLLAHATVVDDHITEFIAGPNNTLFLLNYELVFDPAVNSVGDDFGYTSEGLTYLGGTFLGPASAFAPAFGLPIQYKYGKDSDVLEIETNGFTDGYGYAVFILNSQSSPKGGNFVIVDPQGQLGGSGAGPYASTGSYIPGVVVEKLNDNPSPLSSPIPEPGSLVLMGTGLVGVGVAVGKRST